MQAHKKRVWRRLRSCRDDEKIRAEYKNACDSYAEAVNKFHLEKESGVLNSNNASDFHKFIRRKLNRVEVIPTLLSDSGIPVDDCKAKADLFNNFFSSVFTTDDGSLPTFPDFLNSSIPPIENIVFSPDSVRTKLLCLKKSKTNNPDNFPPIVLQSCAHQLSIPLSIIFNFVFLKSELPSSWLLSTVIPLFKKGQKNLVSNYRPISLTSSCCKVMESIIHDHLTHFLLTNHLISDCQHGFLKSRSTITNLLSSIRHWLTSLNAGKSTDIIFIDFSKAFDSVSHPKLLHKLLSYGVRGKLYNWISAWLTGRTQTVKLEHSFSNPKPVVSGVLQGSVLGPLLFLIYINDLVKYLPANANPTLFADDLKLFSDQVPVTTSRSPFCVSSVLLQEALNKLADWSRLWQLSVNIEKCSVLSISNFKSPKKRSYTFCSNIIHQVSSCSDLGVLVDDKLSFSSHIISMVKKAYRQSFLISRCFISKNSNILKKAFCTYVRPLLEYASQIWSPHCHKDITLIENVQRRFSKTIPNLHCLAYSTRLARLKLPSLYIRRCQLDLCTVYRILHHHIFLESSLFFTLRPTLNIRGHPFTLRIPLTRLNSSKFSFQSRIIKPWNSLPLSVVSVNTLHLFKFKLRCVKLKEPEF
jgi:hypothetical protein